MIDQLFLLWEISLFDIFTYQLARLEWYRELHAVWSDQRVCWNSLAESIHPPWKVTVTPGVVRISQAERIRFGVPGTILCQPRQSHKTIYQMKPQVSGLVLFGSSGRMLTSNRATVILFMKLLGSDVVAMACSRAGVFVDSVTVLGCNFMAMPTSSGLLAESVTRMCTNMVVLDSIDNSTVAYSLAAIGSGIMTTILSSGKGMLVDLTLLDSMPLNTDWSLGTLTSNISLLADAIRWLASCSLICHQTRSGFVRR